MILHEHMIFPKKQLYKAQLLLGFVIKVTSQVFSFDCLSFPEKAAFSYHFIKEKSQNAY